MNGIIGSLCSNPRDFKKAASRRKKTYFEESVQPSEIESYEQKGWEAIRKGKTKSRVRKQKPPDVIFEDRLWMIFYNLGFPIISEDRNFKLQLNSYTKQIDVLARDENNIFIIECRSSQNDAPINARSALEEFVGKQEDIRKALQKEWGRKIGRINYVVAISSQNKRIPDEQYIKDKKDKNIFLWSARELKYIEDLIDQLGSTAKYQLYSVIFAGKKQKALRKDYLALRSKMGGRIFYSFLMSAKDLLNYAYVHHRKLTGIIEASQAYQRMLKSSKLKQIANFIDIEDGYFPNSIIVNFFQHLRWSQKDSIGDIAMGTVTLPEYYGCAWIIDGQHRLYGVASAEKDIVVPVLAFVDVEQKEQANLFVEINEKQKKVPADLLWDLYSDIYRDSTDEKQKFRYYIAETAKKMEASGPLSGYIDVPSVPANRPNKISLTTVCTTIEKYSPWKSIKHPTDETKTPDNAARIINSYFNVLNSLWHEDWAKGNDGVLLTNNAFGVFMMVFNDIVNHLIYKEKQNLLLPSNTRKFEEMLSKEYLSPIVEHLKTNNNLQQSIKREGGRGPQSDNAGLLDLIISDFIPEFSPPRIGKIPPQPQEPPAITNIEAKARNAEPILREFVLEKLQLHYGSDKWWKQGIPGGPKTNADKKWQAEIKRKPHLSREEQSNERKFSYFGLGDIKETIVYGQNWDQIFEPVFIIKSDFERRMKDIQVLRDPTAHTRNLDEQDMVDGIGGLLWLSNCISDHRINPYT